MFNFIHNYKVHFSQRIRETAVKRACSRDAIMHEMGVDVCFCKGVRANLILKTFS